MALVSIQGDWYIYFWLLYCKIYSSIIWLFGNHCRGTDKVRSVISTGVVSQSASSLQRARTRRKRTPQQHRSKHIVALTRRPSLRRIVMAPGSSTAHAMMEDKEKTLHGALPAGTMRSRRISQFAPLLIALVGLPARGKSQLAHRLSRHLNWNGESTKVFDCSEYRRRHMALYGSHDIFRADNLQGSAIRRQSAREAVQDAVLWLKEGNGVAIFDGTNITREQRRELSEYCVSDMGFRILFIECVCEDQTLLERNIIEILHYSADYKSMSEEEAVDDLRKKMEHYMRQYEPIDAVLETVSFVRVEDMGETVTAHKVCGQKESGILGYLSGMRSLPQTLYFTRHGESEYNVLGRIGGDASLSPRGELYGKALSEHINALAVREPFSVWTSELRRTKQTAAEIRAPKRALRALNELDAGICEGLTYEEMQERFPQEFAWRDQDKLRYRYPWGESYIDIMTRLRPVLSALEDEHNVVVVGHQAVLRCMLGYFLDAKLDELPYMNIPLHTVVKLTSYGYKYKVEMIKMDIECVDTHRKQPVGICEGLTYEEMQERFPQEFAWRDQDKLRYRYPWGESYIDIMTRLRPVLSALEDEHNVVVVGHQAVLRCMLGYFLDAKLDELPYMNIPLHTVVKLTSYGYKYKVEMIKMDIECVDTHRKQPVGICEGLTYEEMQERFPQEFAWRDQDKLRYRYPWGESYIDIMTRLRPVLSALEDEHNVVVVGHQAVLRCMLGYFLDAKLDELPYMNIPLHTVVKLTSYGYKYKVEMIKMDIECVDTHRKQPVNCSINRTAIDALVTVPSHYDTLPSNLWQNTSETQL